MFNAIAPDRRNDPEFGKIGTDRIVLMHCSNERPYSITSSASASDVGGTSRPSALAVLRLITNSNLVDCELGDDLRAITF
jgi:hypothetical protein